MADRKNRRTAELMADTVHERLREAILSAAYRPNHRLVEEELAEELEVSRTPVREALLRLRQEGLVEQRKGWIVRDHAPEEILEIIEARAGIEAEAAFLAATRLGGDRLARLDELMTLMEDARISRLRLNELNNEFHEIITEEAGNALIAQFHRRTKIAYWNLSQPVVFTPADDEIVNKQHRELVAALRAGDGEGAARVARARAQHRAHHRRRCRPRLSRPTHPPVEGPFRPTRLWRGRFGSPACGGAASARPPVEGPLRLARLWKGPLRLARLWKGPLRSARRGVAASACPPPRRTLEIMEARPAWTDHTHLFPGAVVRVDGLAAPEPAALHLRLSDGVEVSAELLSGPHGTLVEVAAYTTRAGTRLPARAWPVSSWELRDGAVLLRLGRGR
ncbi:GntR family transcriptional regulator [Nonomuraea sp. NPDC059194]|uniref:GntR family transcriptional regulator n=1 Tax=Nonomuraea sp. NPDC059194 TaxID=3346764 RepID=UPI00368BC31C